MKRKVYFIYLYIISSILFYFILHTFVEYKQNQVTFMLYVWGSV